MPNLQWEYRGAKAPFSASARTGGRRSAISLSPVIPASGYPNTNFSVGGVIKSGIQKRSTL